MSQIDVTTHWRSPKSENPLPVRLRIIEDQGKILALISAPLENPIEKTAQLNAQLDYEFEDAATSIAAVFTLKPLETIWLRELEIEGRLHVRRVIMDEKNGALINARSGVLTPWESAVLKNKDRYGGPRKRVRRWSWSHLVIFGLILGTLFLVLSLNEARRLIINKESEIYSVKRELEEMSQKVLMIDLIEKERQHAEGVKSPLKRVYRQTTNVIITLPPPEKTTPSKTVTVEKSWIELWNEQILKKSISPPSSDP